MSTLINCANIHFRWIGCNCFQIFLPNGKVILTDPWITGNPTTSLDDSTIEQADYMLISHIHGDHIDSVRHLHSRFRPRIVVSATSATEFCKYTEIVPAYLYPVHNRDELCFDDFTLEVIGGRHVEIPRPFRETYPGRTGGEANPDSNALTGWFGLLDVASYLISLPNGFSMLWWGGQITDVQINRLRNLNPQFAIIQFAKQYKVDDYIEMVKSVNPQIVVPQHYDTNYLEDPELVLAMLDETKRRIREELPGIRFLELDKTKWYRLSTAMEVFDERP